jgi:hypothetical protein
MTVTYSHVNERGEVVVIVSGVSKWADGEQCLTNFLDGETPEDTATRWAQEAYGVPLTPGAVVNPDIELAEAIDAATTLAELKAALLGNRGAGMVKGRPV